MDFFTKKIIIYFFVNEKSYKFFKNINVTVFQIKIGKYREIEKGAEGVGILQTIFICLICY